MPAKRSHATQPDVTLLRELERVLKAKPKRAAGLTREAIGAQLGLSDMATLKLLRRIAAEGRLESSRGPAIDIAGRNTTVPVYRIKTA